MDEKRFELVKAILPALIQHYGTYDSVINTAVATADKVLSKLYVNYERR